MNHARVVRITAEQHRSRGIGRQLVQRHPGEVEGVGAPGRGGDGLGHRLGCGERLRRAAGRVPDGAGGAEQPDGSRTRRRARQSLRDVAAACAVR